MLLQKFIMSYYLIVISAKGEIIKLKISFKKLNLPTYKTDFRTTKSLRLKDLC